MTVISHIMSVTYRYFRNQSHMILFRYTSKIPFEISLQEVKQIRYWPLWGHWSRKIKDNPNFRGEFYHLIEHHGEKNEWRTQ